MIRAELQSTAALLQMSLPADELHTAQKYKPINRTKLKGRTEPILQAEAKPAIRHGDKTSRHVTNY